MLSPISSAAVSSGERRGSTRETIMRICHCESMHMFLYGASFAMKCILNAHECQCAGDELLQQEGFERSA